MRLPARRNPDDGPLSDSHPAWEIIQSPGKFEGEPLLTREIWHRVVLEGSADEEYSSDWGTYWALVLDYDRDGMLGGRVSAVITELDNGFVSAEFFDDPREARRRFEEETGLLEPELQDDDDYIFGSDL